MERDNKNRPEVQPKSERVLMTIIAIAIAVELIVAVWLRA